MIVLSCTNISKSYIIDKILDNISFAINDGEKVGLVGLNGAGKTTLFNILNGQIPKDSGDIYISKNCKLGYLQQNTHFQSEQTIFEEALEIFKPLIAMENRLRELEIEISNVGKDESSPILQKLMNEYSHLSEEFSKKNGYGFESEIRGVLKGLGFSENQFYQPINQLSGGQKTRVILAKLLLQKPDILLLDEPTNHLDLQSIDWLEKFIKEYKGATLIISHDRYFLDSTVSKIFHLENTSLKIYTGNYTTYMKKRKKERELLQKKYEEQQSQVSKQEEIISRFMSYGGKRYIRQAQSRQKMLDKIKKLDKPLSDGKRAKIRFEPKVKSGNDVLVVQDLEKYFNDFKLFTNVNFNIYRSEKVGLIGPNGIGKSTLFKIIMNQISNSSGEIRLGHHVNTAYYDQEQTNLNNEKTIVDEIWDENPTLDHYQIRSMLARFLFQGDDIYKEIGNLSGGEKSRIALLKLMLSKANFLLMDEPTNHLDIDSKEVLEDALINYDGTLLVISHDRYFLNKVTNKILDLSKDGIKKYLGNYDYYIEKKNFVFPSEDDEIIEKTKTQIKAERKKEKEKLKEEKKRKQTVKILEKDIAENEETLTELEKLMCTQEIYSDSQKSKEYQNEATKIRVKLDSLYDKWVKLTDS